MEKKLLVFFICLATVLSGCVCNKGVDPDGVTENSKQFVAEGNASDEVDDETKQEEASQVETMPPGPDKTDGIFGDQTDVSSANDESIHKAGIQGSLTIQREIDSTHTMLRDDKPKDYSEYYNKTEATLASIYHAASMDDAVLANIMSAFPYAVQLSGIATSNDVYKQCDPDELYEAITCCESSGSAKTALLEMLEGWTLNANKNIEVTFGIGEGRSTAYRPFLLNEGQGNHPVNTALGLTHIDIEGHRIVCLSVSLPIDENYDRTDFGFFDMSAGFCRLIDWTE